MSVKLYVGNISFRATEDDLRTLFSEAGNVESAKVITDRDTGQSRGFGFVEMSTSEEATKAISMFDGKQWLDREIKVNEAKPQQRTGGERGGGGGGGYGDRGDRGGRGGGGGGGRGGWR